ncbi:hypothetical protein LTR36_006400 [Oleoguttula mirabilis]|uniref:Uncharacterized protein n=1 Tax=Oleoguttula mirabilis TaxID=1507867 RepID=A0AAV9JXN2_9PEZI|nr:hypothetical protein LTR36_006400 [Oleoguttula mirabilis]
MLPLEYCSDDGQAMLAVSAIANFNNFVKAVADLTSTAASTAEAPNSADKKAVLGLSIGSTILSVLGLIPGLEELEPLAVGIKILGAGLSIASAAVSYTEKQGTTAGPSTDPEPGFDNYADIQASINAVNTAVRDNLQQLVDDAMNWIPSSNMDILLANLAYFNDPHHLPTLLRNGTFAAPPLDLQQSYAGPTGPIAAAFATPAIQSSWQKTHTVLIEVSYSRLALDSKLALDPCFDELSNDNYVPRDRKWCDPQSNMWTFLSLPSSPPSQFDDLSDLTPAGVANLTQFGLSIEVLATSAETTQLTSGALSFPAFASHLATLDHGNIQLSDLVSFDVPVATRQ